MHRNILVAIDDSEIAEQVLREAGAQAQAFGARLTILSVAAELPPFAYTAALNVAELEREAVAAAERTVDEARGTMPAGVEVETAVRKGHPGSEIARQVEEGGHDLIVIGSRGRGRVAAGVFGSVVGDVHFAVSVPMLVVHPAARS